jgi:hypothetical protein
MTRAPNTRTNIESEPRRLSGRGTHAGNSGARRFKSTSNKPRH